MLVHGAGGFRRELDPSVLVVDLDAGHLGPSRRCAGTFARRRPRLLLSAMGHANVVAIAARDLTAWTVAWCA